ncbi:hypothetical protein ACQPQX_001757, partial [Campylobacter coli]
ILANAVVLPLYSNNDKSHLCAYAQTFPNLILLQYVICQGVLLHFNTVLKKQRGVNPSWLVSSTVQGKCQGCRKAKPVS